jgi:hypothetical protein
VLANEFEGGGRTDFGDGVKVVAAEEDAEVDELSAPRLVNGSMAAVA